MVLFNYLELAGINDLTASVAKLINVNPPVKIRKWDIDLWGNGFKVKNFFTYKIIYLERE